jgi:hypothetical protein
MRLSRAHACRRNRFWRLRAIPTESLEAIGQEVISGFTLGTALRLQRRTNIAVAIWSRPSNSYALQSTQGMISFDTSLILCGSTPVGPADIVKRRSGGFDEAACNRFPRCAAWGRRND